MAFSCKGRGFCPSCLGRRMNEGAANLMDHVLPEGVPIRLWVVTLPYPLRYPLAFDGRRLSSHSHWRRHIVPRPKEVSEEPAQQNGTAESGPNPTPDAEKKRERVLAADTPPGMNYPGHPPACDGVLGSVGISQQVA